MDRVSAEDAAEYARARKYLELSIERDPEFAPPLLGLRYLIRRITPSFNPIEDSNLLATARMIAGYPAKAARGLNYCITVLSTMPAGEFLAGAWYELLLKDYKRAVQHYQNSAKAGYALSQANLAVCLKQGRGCSVDLAAAVAWYRKAADQGYAVARYNLGFCYLNGEGVEKNPENAFNCYLKIAAQGHVGSMYSLGHLYMDGNGVAKDAKEAASWYRKAAQLDNAPAQAMYARCLLDGVGVSLILLRGCNFSSSLYSHDWAAQVDADPKEAVGWLLKVCFSFSFLFFFVALSLHAHASRFLKSAEGNNSNGRVYLAACYLQGIGVSQNNFEAFQLLKKAAAEDGTPFLPLPLGLSSATAHFQQSLSMCG